MTEHNLDAGMCPSLAPPGLVAPFRLPHPTSIFVKESFWRSRIDLYSMKRFRKVVGDVRLMSRLL